MLPIEKAKELVLKFIEFTPAEEQYELPYAKKCAHITVDEILYTYEYISAHLSSEWCNKQIAYMQQVKQEIEKY